MKITTELVKTFNPCKDRFHNYQTNYPNSDLHIVDFLKLENITYNDKIWVWKKVATINEAALFGLKCADSVLHIFEDKYPNDKRPRLALDSVRTYLDNPTEENKKECREASYDAAFAAYDVYATAAYSAAYSAAYAAYAVIAYSTAYTAPYVAAYAADAADTAAAGKTQQDKNIQFLIEIYEGK